MHCVGEIAAELGESPVWVAETQTLLWVDIAGRTVFETAINSGHTRSYPVGELVGCVVPTASGGAIVGMESGLYSLDRHSGSMKPVGASVGEPTGRRFNDGKCDPTGRLWIGRFAINARSGGGSLYRFNSNSILSVAASGFTVPNGLGWSPDGTTFYFTDTGARTIHAYEFLAGAGLLGQHRVFARFGDGGAPDGLAVDAEGGVWTALWDGWRVERYAPDGRLDRVVPVPVPRPTSCAFGGVDLRTLFVTTARVRLSRSQLALAPLSGRLLAIDVEVPGQPVARYAGDEHEGSLLANPLLSKLDRKPLPELTSAIGRSRRRRG